MSKQGKQTHSQSTYDTGMRPFALQCVLTIKGPHMSKSWISKNFLLFCTKKKAYINFTTCLFHFFAALPCLKKGQATQSANSRRPRPWWHQKRSPKLNQRKTTGSPFYSIPAASRGEPPVWICAKLIALGTRSRNWDGLCVLCWNFMLVKFAVLIPYDLVT